MCFKEIKKRCEEHLRITITLFFIILAFIIGAFFFCVFTPQNESVGSPIGVEPQKLDVSLSQGENFTKTISISVKKQGDVNITLYANKLMYDWVPSINRSFHVEANETYYINVEFVNLSNATFGEYEGRIEITHNGSVEKKIPIILTIKPREIIPKNVSILLVP
jgi:hypothetical protein